MTGTVKLWRERTSWGFIQGENGIEYFAHAKGLVKKNHERIDLVAGERVEFQDVPSETPGRGPCAIDIRRLP